MAVMRWWSRKLVVVTGVVTEVGNGVVTEVGGSHGSDHRIRWWSRGWS
jgi:hypothetical protein